MPSFVIPQGVVVRLIWRLGSADTAVNVLGAKNTTSLSITQTLADTIGAAIKTQFTSTALKAIMATNISLYKVGLRDINSANLPEFMDSGVGVSGTGSGDALPLQVSYCVTIRTALAGKRYRGRYYQFGLTESSNDTNGAPLTASVTTCVAFVNAIGSVLSGNGLTPAVLSRAGNVATPWTSAVQRSTTWATQRRRLIPGI